MVSVRRSAWDKKRAVRAQQKREVDLRRERREDIQAHEMQGLTTKEAGEDRRTQAIGEFAGARQESINRAGLQQTGIRQAGETGRTEMRQAGERSRLGLKESGLGVRQATAIGAQREAATLADERSTSRFHKELGAKAYMGGQDPEVAGQLASSSSFHTDYGGLKPVAQASKKKMFDPTYSDEASPKLITPGGFMDESTGKRTFFDDEETLKALIAKLKEERTSQALGR